MVRDGAGAEQLLIRQVLRWGLLGLTLGGVAQLLLELSVLLACNRSCIMIAH